MELVKIYLVALLNHLASIVACSSTLEPIRGNYNNSSPFSNLDLMDECEEKCTDQLIECLLSCETVECETECRRAEVNCSNGKQPRLVIIFLNIIKNVHLKKTS